MKHCADKNCAELNPQPLGDFYENPKSADGHGCYCKVCHRRRMSEREAKCRQQNLENGMPVMSHRHGWKSSGDSYLERHEARRKEEAEIEASLMDLDLRTDGLEVSSASNWNGLIDSMLRPKKKEFSWAVR